jgi:hypothetical protein
MSTALKQWNIFLKKFFQWNIEEIIWCILASSNSICIDCECHWKKLEDWVYKYFRQASMLWSQFSAIFANFRRKIWRFSQKPMLWSQFLLNFSAKIFKKS